MIAVIFEVEPAAGQENPYLAAAADLRAVLDKVDGFLSVERFRSLVNPEKILSLSFFEDEEAVARWRNTAAHRHAQASGRDKIFSNYHLRIAHVIRSYGMSDRKQAPDDSKKLFLADGDGWPVRSGHTTGGSG